MNKLSRRGVLKGTALGTGAVIAGRYRPAFGQAAGPLRFTVLTALSGPLAVVGQEVKTGAEICVKLINDGGGVAGRTIELNMVDDKARPTDTVAALREQISSGNTLLGGIMLSSALLAAIPVLNDTKTVLVSSSGNAANFTHESFSRYVFPGLETDYQASGALAKLMVQKLPDAKVFSTVISDSQPFVQSYVRFQRFAKPRYASIGKSPKFLDPLIAKIGTTDIRPQLAELASSDSDTFYNYVIGADGITFWQQAQAFNLGKKFKAVVDQTLDVSVLKILKKNMPPNLWTRLGWYHGLHNDVAFNNAFYKEYVARTGDTLPSGYMQYGCMCVVPLAEAVRHTGGKTNSESLIKALETIKFNTVKGEFYFRKEDHLVIGPIDFCKVVPTDEAPGAAVIDGVSMNSLEFAFPPDPGKPFQEG